MPSITDVGTIFKTIREIDLKAIADEAQQQTWVAIVGNEADGTRDLCAAFYLAPRPLPPQDASHSMAGPMLARFDDEGVIERADLIVVVVREERALTDPERQAFQGWLSHAKKIVVVFNRPAGNAPLPPFNDWIGARVLQGPVNERSFLERQFVPTVLQLLPERKLPLARNFPLFRIPVATDLIGETSFANASYAFSTGIAEIVPVLNVPFNVADMFILTKAQAFMVYRLGLAFGLSTRWQDHLSEFGSIIGFGFVWRTVARQLVGLIPGFGIIPKVAIAYAGTYALGRAALQWYETGRSVSRGDLERFFKEALGRGKALAGSLAKNAPRVRRPQWRLPGLPFRKRKPEPNALPAGTENP